MILLMMLPCILTSVLARPDVSHLFDENGYQYPKPQVPFELPSNNNIVVVPKQQPKVMAKNDYLPPKQSPTTITPIYSRPAFSTTPQPVRPLSTTRKPDYLPPLIQPKKTNFESPRQFVTTRPTLRSTTRAPQPTIPPSSPYSPNVPLDVKDTNYPPLIFLGTSTFEPDLASASEATNQVNVKVSKQNTDYLPPKNVVPVTPKSYFNTPPSTAQTVFETPKQPEESRQDEVTIPTSTFQPFNEVDGYDYTKPMKPFELPKPEEPEETRQDEVTVRTTITPNNDYLPPAATNQVSSTIKPDNDYLPPAATNQVSSTIKPDNDYLPPAATNQVVSTVQPFNDYLPPAATNQVSTVQPFDEDKGYDYTKPTVPFEIPKQPEESRQDEVQIITSTLQPFNEVDGYDYTKPMKSFELPRNEPQESKTNQVLFSTQETICDCKTAKSPTIEIPKRPEESRQDNVIVPSSTLQPYNDEDGYDYRKPAKSFDLPAASNVRKTIFDFPEPSRSSPQPFGARGYLAPNLIVPNQPQESRVISSTLNPLNDNSRQNFRPVVINDVFSPPTRPQIPQNTPSRKTMDDYLPPLAALVSGSNNKLKRNANYWLN